MEQLALDWLSYTAEEPNVPFPKKSISNVVHIVINDKWHQVWETLKTNEDLNYIEDGQTNSLSQLILTATQAIYDAIVDQYTVFIGWSSGKDSSTVLMLFLMALMRAKREGHDISPHHCLQHTDTLVESPTVHQHAMDCLEDLEIFIEKHQLPLSILIAKPELTQSFTGRILTGRGLPTFAGSSRQCSIDLKVKPAQKAKKAYLKGIDKKWADKTLLLLGSRDDEGAIRASNIAKYSGDAITPNSVSKTESELYPIKHWSSGNVWEFLLSCGDDDAKYPLPNYRRDSTDTANIYKDATGECVFSGKNALKSKSCGSRFGCWSCQVSGGDDKSASNLINSNDKYAYLKPLHRIQQLLAKTRYDWSIRHPVGRTIYLNEKGEGKIKIQPDVYSPAFLEKLLRACVSADVAEEKRAHEHRKNFENGKLEDNAFNRRMIFPQFKIINEQRLVHIDFMWAFHGFNANPFRALEIYHEVINEGKLDLLAEVDDMDYVARTPIPKTKYLSVDTWADGSLLDGLSDPFTDLVYFDAEEMPDEIVGRIINTKQGPRRVTSILEDDKLTVDEDAAEFIVNTEYPNYLRDKKDTYNPSYAFQYFLRFGAVQLCKGKQALYHTMAQRGQCYRRMGLNGQLTMDEIINNNNFIITDSL
ncbi:phosphoadenosine phosphosulfate reductase family protein [Shewanella aestuarii]|uniref:Phosphoadenosine phosphosulfate reductase n=1 Tax=Shewanella aestuarii TaxID=1028752 RepID=A0A6G9QQW3_9GAMM|nr:phosphoadenosine phosphosulfate reductase family protein [Shewanella aestuarii]QIR16455.1 phosphoadenosine phosphosulfate reductase [Shewanella aestuarii]